MSNFNSPPETYSAEPTCDGTGWMVVHRKWRGKKHGPGPRLAPVERILKTFHGPSAKLEAFALAGRKTGKRGKSYAKRRMHG